MIKIFQFILLVILYILPGITLFNTYDVKANDCECGCLTCYEFKTEEPLVLGVISNVCFTEVSKLNLLCNKKYPKSCKMIHGKLDCSWLWDSMETGACSKKTCKKNACKRFSCTSFPKKMLRHVPE